MPGFRRWGTSKFQKNPESSFKLLAAVLVITLYLIIKEFSQPIVRTASKWHSYGAQIQHVAGRNETRPKADLPKAEKLKEAMKFTFWKYRERAWGCDDVLPVTGGNSTSRNGWGAFIVDSSTTLAVMGLWDELALCVDHIIQIDFTKSKDLVDTFETTIRYLGGLVSLVDLSDAGVIPAHVISVEARDQILQQAVTLAKALGPAYDSPTNMPWPRVNFSSEDGVPDPPTVYHEHYDTPKAKFKTTHTTIGPARSGSSILETRTLTRLTGDSVYAGNSTKAWGPLVWSNYSSSFKGMVDAPIDITVGYPTGRQKHWDAGHDSYYEYLLKITILAPPWDPFMADYKERFLEAAYSLRKHLSSRSAASPKYSMQHLFIGRQDDHWFLNEQGHLACFAPGTLLLGSKVFDQPYLRTFALALLEGCHHAYTSTPSKVGPEKWSWIPKFGFDEPVFQPADQRQRSEWAAHGFWSTDPVYKGRPEYVESLFYAWRITGENRFREWAWEAWTALDTHCKAPYGYAQLADVYKPKAEEWQDAEGRWIDMQESFWTAETLKYLYLTFSDVEVANLDRWVFSTEGHLFRMIR